MKQKTYKEQQHDSERGKRRYLERLAADREAKAEQEDALAELTKLSQEMGLYDDEITYRDR